jgi:hypothetical protein
MLVSPTSKTAIPLSGNTETVSTSSYITPPVYFAIRKPLFLYEEIMLLAVRNEQGTSRPATWSIRPFCKRIAIGGFTTLRMRAWRSKKRLVNRRLLAGPFPRKPSIGRPNWKLAETLSSIYWHDGELPFLDNQGSSSERIASGFPV